MCCLVHLLQTNSLALFLRASLFLRSFSGRTPHHFVAFPHSFFCNKPTTSHAPFMFVLLCCCHLIIIIPLTNQFTGFISNSIHLICIINWLVLKKQWVLSNISSNSTHSCRRLTLTLRHHGCKSAVWKLTKCLTLLCQMRWDKKVDVLLLFFEWILFMKEN